MNGFYKDGLHLFPNTQKGPLRQQRPCRDGEAGAKFYEESYSFTVIRPSV